MNRYEEYIWYKEYIATHVYVLYVQCIDTHTSIYTYAYICISST